MALLDESIAIRAGNLDRPVEAARNKPDVSPGYIPALDGLRAVSILLVLAYHDIGPLTSRFGHTFNGWIGVDVFFVISGYLITSILLREARENNGDFSLTRFYIRRWLRIAPAYYTCLAVVMALAIMGGDHHLKPFLAAACYLTNLDIAYSWNLIPSNLHLSHFWSLGLEEQFYLAWPLCLKVLKRKATIFVVAVIGAVLVWRFTLLAEGATWLRLLHGFDTNVDAIMFGVLTALLLSFGAIQSVARRFIGGTLAQIALSLLAIFAFKEIGHPTYYDASGQFYFWEARLPATLVIISLAMTSIISNPRGPVARFLSNPLFVFVGKLSYSLYLWHVLVHMMYCGYFVNYVSQHAYSAELIQYILIFAAACVSYFLIEKPFLKLKFCFDTGSAGRTRKTPPAAVLQPLPVSGA